MAASDHTKAALFSETIDGLFIKYGSFRHGTSEVVERLFGPDKSLTIVIGDAGAVALRANAEFGICREPTEDGYDGHSCVVQPQDSNDIPSIVLGVGDDGRLTLTAHREEVIDHELDAATTIEVATWLGAATLPVAR
ncbi:MAG TPA: hypothetical protein VIM53_01505 [Candidatus Saccharimonadales bacterium]